MNHIQAACGHMVVAVGAPGSQARQLCEEEDCDLCRSVIPPITHPDGLRYWEQPAVDEIAIDEHSAIMTEATFKKLLNYERLNPSGVYVGKMWRRGAEWLCWHSQSRREECLLLNSRRIIVV
jgi:hypothetical protein